MACLTCGAAEQITTTVRDATGLPLEGILHCSVDPAHDVGEPYLTLLREVLARMAHAALN